MAIVRVPGVRVVTPQHRTLICQELYMATEMSFAQALNEAKGVIIQLSNRVKTDAEKLKSQQATIKQQEETIARQTGEIAAAQTRQAEEVAAAQARVQQADAARDTAEAIINRQGEKITSLESQIAELQCRLNDQQAQIATISSERDALRAQLPSDDDTAALASMSQLLAKAAPVIEKAKKAAPTMRLADDGEQTVLAEAA